LPDPTLVMLIGIAIFLAIVEVVKLQNDSAERRKVSRFYSRAEWRQRKRVDRDCRDAARNYEDSNNQLAPDSELVRCNNLSPDGALRCRLELGHAGWHTERGSDSWDFGGWASDDWRGQGQQ